MLLLAAGLAACGDTTAPRSSPTPPTPTAPAGPDVPVPPTETVPAPSPLASPDVVVHRTEVPTLHPSVDGYDRTTLEIETADGTRHRLAVLVARTTDERTHGLMEVPELPDGTGMWFVYEEDRTGGFWMKNTLVPLDIAYVQADGRIGDIERMTPCTTDPCPTYPPEGSYRTALEVPAGWFEEQGIEVGDEVREVS